MASPPSEAVSSATTADAASPSSSSSAFSHVPRAPEVPIYAVMRACSEDTSPLKLNLGMGVYRTEEGKPLLLNVVRRAEEILLNDKTTVKEYLPITGLPEFNRLSATLIFGADSDAIKEKRVVTVQSISGTGSLRIGADFLAKHYHQKIVYIPQPTYSNHPNFFIVTGLSVRTYRHYDPQTRGLDYQGLLEDLRSAPSGATVLFHACAHNPTGVDPTLDQWEEIRQLMRCRGLFPFFDCAYQGFVSGSLEEDARPVRMFVADGGECIVVQSFSKNMGLYGERVGALSIIKLGRNFPFYQYNVCQNAEVASRSESQLKLLIRPMYSSPPIHGAAIAASIMKNRVMQDEWEIELRAMRNRLVDTRLRLYEALLQRGTPGDWSHIIKQVGLFTYSGLSEEQVAFMTQEYHIYMPPDGRMNMAGLSPSTVPRLAEAIHVAVTMNT